MRANYDDFCDITTYERTTLDPDNVDFGAIDQLYIDEFNVRIREPGEGDSQTSTCYVTDGNVVASQPKFSASLSPSYNTDIGGLRFSARMDVRHEGMQFDNSINYNSYPAVTTANLSFGLSGDQWSATLYVNNLTDENSPTRIAGGGDNSRQFGLIGQPLNSAEINALITAGTLPDDLPEEEYNDITGYLGETIEGGDLTRDNFNFRPRQPRTVGLRASYRF
jgi:hypothetical protein